jgi:hypothetical protein
MVIFINYIEPSDFAPIHTSIIYKVITPNMIAMVSPQPDTVTVRQKYAAAFGLFCRKL